MATNPEGVMGMLGFSQDRRGLQLIGVVAVLTAAVGILLTGAATAGASQKTSRGSRASSGWTWSKGQSLPGASNVSVIEGLSCPSSSLCLIPANRNGKTGTGVYWSHNPAGGASAWHFLAVAAPFGGDISCDKVEGTSYYCDVAGNSLWTSGAPTTGWNAVDLAGAYSTPTYTPLGAVSCWVNVECVEADESGNILSTDAALVKSGPVLVFHTESGGGQSVSCAPFRSGANVFCAAVDSNPGSGGHDGEVAWSTDPSSGTWITGDTTDGSDLVKIACPSDALCVALEGGAGDEAYIGVSSDRATGKSWAKTWKAVDVPARTAGGFSPELTALTCYSDSLCAVSGHNSSGNFVYTSTHPAATLSAWTESMLDDGAASDSYTSAAGVACPSASECVVVSGEGQVSVGKP